MARDNYSYQKYRREQAKKKKREEKIQRKLDKKKIQPEEGLGQVPGGDLVAGPVNEAEDSPADPGSILDGPKGNKGA